MLARLMPSSGILAYMASNNNSRANRPQMRCDAILCPEQKKFSSCIMGIGVVKKIRENHVVKTLGAGNAGSNQEKAAVQEH